MHCIRSFLVVLFLEYFSRQNKVFLTYLKMSNLAKKKKTGKPLPQKQTSIVNFFKKKSSNCSGNMSVDFAQSSSHSSPGLLNDSGIPPSHIINPDGDDRALEYELERSRDAIQNISLFSSQKK